MHEHLNTQLSAYLDGDLAGDELARAEAHLASCDACRAELEGLRRLVRRAAALDDRGPEKDLWSGIAARIATPSSADVLPFEPKKRRFSFTVPQLAAAAVALMAVSSGAAMLLTRDPGTTGPVAIGPQLEAPGRPVVYVAPAEETMAGYDSAITGLQEIVQARRADLDTATVRIIDQSMAVIDAAIAQARSALERDPNNRYLNSHLQNALGRKLGLLRQAARLPATSI